MNLVAVLGEKKMVLVFKSLGIDVFSLESDQDFGQSLEKIEQKKYSILFITDSTAQKYRAKLEYLYNQTLPAILIIPGNSKNRDFGKNNLSKIIERALGGDLNI